MESNKKWYAVYTKPRWEKKVHKLLQARDIESWCPIQKIERQWTDRKKIIEEPLFRSYVFVNIDIANKLDVQIVDGVLNFVHYLGKPAIIKDEEILLIKKYLDEADVKVTVQSIEGFKKDMKVLVTHGVFMNNSGTVIKSGNKKVHVRLETLGQVMTVEFSANHLYSQN
ncbi:MAG: UpxY family transcription antiterminator [Chitinophagaceae bacterium]|jgi:transcription antitermination factor NusG|nr:UpxY family transcription antiterminator [Chitinophagaceae bacterium]